MPIKVSDLYNRIIEDELPSSNPGSLDKLHHFIRLSREIFQKEIAGRYFLRYKSHTLMVKSADPYGLCAESFYPAKSNWLSFSLGSDQFEDYSLVDEQELTPDELRDLKESGLVFSLSQSPKLIKWKDPLEDIGCPNSRSLPSCTPEQQEDNAILEELL